MRVSTPIADMEITVDRITVSDGALVMTNSAEDAMATRTVMGPGDVRKIFGALLRPSVLWFALICLFRREDGSSNQNSAPGEDHPTPNPW